MGDGDKWSDWLLRRRSGGEPGGHARMQVRLRPVRDRVLDNAALVPGATLLDVGTGDGLIGLAALERVGARGNVIFSDISVPCLDYVAREAAALGASDRATFIAASAESLQQIAGASVDAVTTRSVLIYVKEKRAAFDEFARVLRPGGRISLAEPINLDHLGRRNDFYGYDATAVAALIDRYDTEYGIPDPREDPMTDFTERDLVAYCESAGFAETHLELRIDITSREPRDWYAFMNFAPNPNAPTVAESFDALFSAAECRALESHFRPLVERGIGTERMVMAYIWAIK